MDTTAATCSFVTKSLALHGAKLYKHTCPIVLLPRDAMLALNMLSSCVHPSVCLWQASTIP